MALASEAVARPRTPPILTENHFSGDHAGSISEDGLQGGARRAGVPGGEGARGHRPGAGLVRAGHGRAAAGGHSALADALQTSGEFELSSEVSTDFPVDRGISGLRELAARYRCDYLLIYRHRFVDASYMNPVAWGSSPAWARLFLPGHTLESAGVLEATLFDVKTGTLLFTVNERVHAQEQVNLWHNDLKTQWMKKQMLESATQKLADQVVGKIRRLVVARPAPERKSSERGGIVPGAAGGSSNPARQEPTSAQVPVTVSTPGS